MNSDMSNGWMKYQKCMHKISNPKTNNNKTITPNNNKTKNTTPKMKIIKKINQSHSHSHSQRKRQTKTTK